MREPISARERFMQKVTVTDGCWLWTGAITPNGYGKFKAASYQAVDTHRWAYEHFVGPIPDGLVLDHTCHTNDLTCPGGACAHRSCVNPEHLEPVTQVENMRRAALRGNRCPRGHEWTPENTHWTGRYRHCRTCGRDAKRISRAKAAA